MPVLFERVKNLSQQIQQLANSQVTEDESIGFRTRAEELSNPSAAIAVPTRRLELFRTKGIQVELSVQKARALKSTIDEMARQYDTEPRSILTPDANWRLITRTGLNQLAGLINEELSVGWRSYLSGIKPTIDQGLLIVLQSSPSYVNHANRVSELSSAFDTLANRLPTNQEEIDRPRELAAALRDAIENLPLDIPEPVRQLFVAISRRSATAGHLTDEALDWLRERDMLDTIVVSWRSG